ncbi:hypothetical protein [Haloarcula litorea]|uniref:hypothetical protein n=1 Tax=Haloarcula litorea TaxID=3032579 RepID=UPI0023E87547|nr:hypothetical protein [Halomicroarcula sp. GDY20]
MDRWVDPDETDPEAWGGSAAVEGGGVRSVLERADATPLPYQYEVDLLHEGGVAETFRSREYERARVIYNCGVDAERRVKLLTRGVLWGGEERHQRFKAQYRREPPPTETVPFGEYTVWTRFQYGTIEPNDDGATFVPDESDAGETMQDLDWADLYAPVQRRLAELELARNPAFARYRLEESGEWADVRAALAFDPTAFAVGP